ncbi:dihydrodipicolinate synthase family protein [Paracandidimonas soli]|uniref:4-hydroxy-tetrahydrodipicolinate synthase n=1 Tax=Paracandidimonas soli TaxID=1917182 RepID=A0A4R3V5A8_9BURK|nr:dihydrodipicolinate synthase family protein [Paracandidimonas soli]TCU98498.1 4-hydroxy-tetrahydrodipicolinate synthase [Paracandidimonas soli]
MLLTSKARGVFPIAPTPFLDDGAIDTASIDRITDFYLECGSTGLTVLGLLGEAPKLEHAEAVAVAKQMISRAASIPVIVGATAPGFAAMRALTREVMDLGAAGVMIAPPNTLRTDEQILNYYHQVAQAIGTDVPIVVQDFPQVFQVQMSPSLLRQMFQEIGSLAMLKHEDWPGLDKISTLRRYEHEGSMRHIPILCGSNGIFLDYEMARGADGANTGYCFPDMLCEFLSLRESGNVEAAQDLFDAHLPLIRYEQQPGVGLAVRKHVLMRRGLITSAAQRKPSGTLSATARDEVEHLLRRLARKDPRAQL